MASGLLGKADLAAATDTTLWTAPAGLTHTVSVYMANRNATAVTVRVAVAATGTPANSEYIDFETTIPANGVYRESGIPVSAAELVVVRASTTGVSASVRGYGGAQ